jgi:hypothetical protein
MCSVQGWQNGSHLASAPDRCLGRASMRVVPYGLGWSSPCVLSGREVARKCDSGRLPMLCRVFFLANKGETFGFVQDLILMLKKRDMEMLFEIFVATMAHNLKTLYLKPYVMIWVSNINFPHPISLVRMVWLKGKSVPFVRWLGRCSMSI